jgi:hypothetical protein
LVSIYLNFDMTELPLDPHDCPGTPEFNELLEERAHRAYLLREAMMEDEECFRHHSRR